MRVLIDEQEIADAVARLGAVLTEEYRDRPLTVVGVLTGSMILVADLVRRIRVPHRIGVIQASSYRGTSTSPGELTINTELLPDIKGHDVLLIDDIFDTGRTLDALVEQVLAAGARSVKTAVLLWKQDRREVERTPDFHAFEIPDEFVVGYGLDYDDDFRYLPYIAVIEAADLEEKNAAEDET